jgi:membrane-associated PAP2 superfamily phosphatase
MRKTLERIGRYRREWLPQVAIVLLLALLTEAISAWCPFDVPASLLFYDGSPADDGWFLTRTPPWLFLRRFAAIPAVVLAGGAAAFLLWTRKRPAWPGRVRAGFLLLLLVAGPGLLVNVVLKLNWGRPRPKHVDAFGGTDEFRAALDPGASADDRSFPCGHSSVGYYLGVALYLLWRRRHPRRANWALLLGTLYGTVVGVARMAVGAHFLSDVLWSAYLVAACGLVLYYFILNVPACEDGIAVQHRLFGSRRLFTATVAALVAAVALGVVASSPVELNRTYRVGTDRSRMGLTIEMDRGEVVLVPATGDAVTVRHEARGFGAPGARFASEWGREPRAGLPRFRLRAGRVGWFTEATDTVRVEFDTNGVAFVTVRMERGRVLLAGPDRAFPSLTVEPAGRWPVPIVRIRPDSRSGAVRPRAESPGRSSPP